MEIVLATRKRRRGAWCIALWKQSILVAKRSKHVNNAGQWNIPGGNVDKKELPEAAALRELKEEVGIRPATIASMRSFSFRSGQDMTYVVLMRVTSPKVRLNRKESSKFQWMPLGSIQKSMKSRPNSWHSATLKILNKDVIRSAVVKELQNDKEQRTKDLPKRASRGK